MPRVKLSVSDKKGFAKKRIWSYVPVISLNFSGLKNEGDGWELTLPMIRCGIAAVSYGDLLMLLSESDKTVRKK